MNDMNSYYYTQSLNIAAYLVSKGYRVIKTDTNSSGITTFFFDRVESIFQLVREYNANDDLKKFIAAYKDLKQMLKRTV